MDVCSMMKEGRLSHRYGYCHVPWSHSFSVTPGYRAKQTAGHWGVGDVNWIVTHTLPLKTNDVAVEKQMHMTAVLSYQTCICFYV